MCSIARRWSLRRRFVPARSSMMCTIARRRSSPLRTRCSSRSTSPRSAASSSNSPAISSGAMSGAVATIGLPLLAKLLERPAHALELLLESDHLQFTAHDDLFELLEVQDLLLQLAFGLFQVANRPLVRTHVAKDPDGPNNAPIEISQRGRVQRRRDDFARSAARIQARVA